MNKLTKILSITALVAMTTVTGCASVQYTPDWTQAGVTVEHDKFERQTKLEGALNYGIDVDSRDHAFFRAWVMDDAESLNIRLADGSKVDLGAIQLYVVAHGYDWMFIKRAYDADGKEFSVVRIASDVDCGNYTCNHYEHVGLQMGRDYLREHKSGLELKLAGRGGDKVITIPAVQIEQILTALEQVHAAQ